ncbi:tetratricopeptide repeat protein [bacterium]|nr:tetratricopeptide repeat protein [bacterium]MDB4798085.1 tetratricopeptide repeat protein [Verrucomicrobiota bacterium]
MKKQLDDGASESGSASTLRPKQPVPSKSKIWAFRLVLLLLSHLIVLGGIELVARLVGIGYPTAFFSRVSYDSSEFIEANHRFFWSFFPKALSRSPQPVHFSENVPKGVKRIFFFGESAAMGDPEPAFGMARILETLLEARHPEVDFEVINLAVTAINSHVIWPIARESTRYNADFWCVYMGNNEVHGQFGPGTVFGQSESKIGLIRTSLAVKRTRIGQIANLLAGGLGGQGAIKTDWEGMAMFENHQVFADDPRLAGVYSNFETNLKDIADAGSHSGANVLLSNIAVNLKGSSPFESAFPKSLSTKALEKWESDLEEGKQLLDAGLASDAIPKFQSAIATFDGHAESHYLIGRCHGALLDFASAQTSFLKARDLDGLRFRTDGRMNEIIKEVAESHPSERVSFVNAKAMVAINAPNRIPGDELFWDHVHLRFPGNYLVALSFAQKMEESLYRKDAIAKLSPWISLSDCAQALTLTRWIDYQTTQSMRQRLNEEPFRSQSVHRERDERLKLELEQHVVGISPEAFPVHQDLFSRALQRNPDDAILRDLFARYLVSQNRVDEAAKEWATVVKQVPSHLMAHYQRGSALAAIPTRAKEAEASLRRALSIRPDTVDITVALGKALYTQKRYQAALNEFEAALTLRPTALEALLEASHALVALGRKGEAIQRLEQAAKIAPNHSTIATELRGLRGR